MMMRALRRPRRTFDAMVLGGGGARGLCMLGSLTYLRNHGHLRDVKTFVGSSVGAILAAAMALDMDPTEVFRRRVLPFTFQRDVNIMNLERSFGLDSGKSLDAFIAEVIPAGVSFKSLYEARGKRLVVTATNLTTTLPEYFSAATSPDLDLRKALRMSCSVPVFFNAVVHEGCVYVDGGVSDNYPASHALELGCASVLGVRFQARKPEVSRVAPMTFDRFVTSLLESSIRRAAPKGVTTLTLHTDAQPLDFKMSKAAMLDHYDDGYAQTETFFKKNV
jgi:predicted acylesterase/phospholipase RssA